MVDIVNLGVPDDMHATRTERRKKEHRKKDGRLAMWIAIVSAVGAIAASVVAGVQVHEAYQQNVLSVQQQLLQLTTSIAQLYDERTINQNQAVGTLTGSARTAALSEAGVAWTDQLVADGEAAQVMISYLNGRGVVASIEYMETANALVAGEDDAQAIEYYRDAVNAPPETPLTEVDALRLEGGVYYDLGEAATGHALMMQAVGIYNGNKDLTRAEIAGSVSQSFADDAWHEMRAGNCKVGLAEFTDARSRFIPVGGGNATNQSWISSDAAEYKQQCG